MVAFAFSGLPVFVFTGPIQGLHDFAALDANLRIIIQQLIGNPDQLALNLVRQKLLVIFKASDSHTEGGTIDLSGRDIAFGQFDHAEVLGFSDDLRTFLRQVCKRLQDNLFTFDKADDLQGLFGAGNRT